MSEITQSRETLRWGAQSQETLRSRIFNKNLVELTMYKK